MTGLQTSLDKHESSEAFALQPRRQAKRAHVERFVNERLPSALLNCKNISSYTNVSRSTLFRLFADEGGVIAYIRQKRLERVAEDLNTLPVNVTITDIAERWGFCDGANMATSFRKLYGVTPSEYRASRRLPKRS